MINYFVSIWDWVRNSALHQLILVLIILVSSFLILSKYPICLEVRTTEVKDLVEMDKDTTYVIHSEITEEGAKLFVNTNTYFTKISKNENK